MQKSAQPEIVWLGYDAMTRAPVWHSVDDIFMPMHPKLEFAHL